MSWEGIHILWDEAMLDERREAASHLDGQGAVHHLISDDTDWSLADLVITRSEVVPGLCVPVIRATGGKQFVCCEIIESHVPAPDFVDRIHDWKHIRQKAAELNIEDQPVVNEETRSSLERLAGREVLWVGRRKFLNSAGKYLQKLQNSKNQEDWEEMTKVLHTLKGSSGTIGAMQVSAASRKWEEMTGQPSYTGQDFRNQLYLLKMLLEYFRYHTLDWGKQS